MQPYTGSDASSVLPADASVGLPSELPSLLASAWASYDLGALDEAISLAMAACTLAPDHPDSQAALAWFLLESGEQEQAELILLYALDRHPNFPVFHWYLGILKRGQLRLDEAKAFLLRALQLNPDLDDAAVALAWVLHDMGGIVEATVWARRALAQQKLPEREALLGWLLLLQEQHGDAAVLLQSALSSLPHRAHLRCHLASAWQALHRIDDAIALLKEGLALSPDDHGLLLSLGWLHLERGEFEPARSTAEHLVQQNPDLAMAWHMLGVACSMGGDSDQAEHCFSEALARDGALADARLQRAYLLQEAGRLDEARQQIHHLLQQSPRDGRLWLFLARVMLKRGRRGVAQRMLRRARRLTPDDADIWCVSGWEALEDGDLELARQSIRRLMELVPDDPWCDVQAAFVLEACGDLDAASMHAEKALSMLPEKAESWRALAKVRYRQNRMQEASSLLLKARQLDPDSIDIDLQLGWVYLSNNRLDEAEAEFERAVAKDAMNSTIWLEMAEVRQRAGRISQALESLQQALNLQPDRVDALLLKARILAHGGPEEASEAASICSQLLLDGQLMRDAAMLLIRMAAFGNALALTTLRTLDRQALERYYLDALELAQGRYGNRMFGQLSALAVSDFPENLILSTAAFFAQGMDEATCAEDVARYARQWSGRLASAAGQNPVVLIPTGNGEKKLRIAYVAAHFHRSLLAPVLAAHNSHMVDLFLYTDAPTEDLAGLGRHIAIHPLRGQNLAASMAANGIDVAVDTVGVHPFLGQFEVLQQFAMRVAPVQCAWLGSWAGSAGVFDVLIADQVSLPPSHESFYEEAIVRLAGGQWCWEPPAVSHGIGQLPCLRSGSLTFGSSVRGLRLTRRTLKVWGELLARLPGSCLLLAGEHGQDWQFRQEFSEILSALGVDYGRVHFQPRRNYDEYLEFYRNIDVALDAFPSNGGLCLIDALWMGVPFVTNAGVLLGERQGMSLLAAIGHKEWAASDDEEYVEIALNLAADRPLLISLRKALRQELLRSPLVDGVRVARSLEQTFLQNRIGAPEEAVQPSQNIVETLAYTGERFMPGIRGRIEVEHLHRYAVALRLARGKDVLDIACGEGYGTRLLAGVARFAAGVDISSQAVAHARRTYSASNMEFNCGSCAAIPYPDQSFDLVVSFETIEHHDQHEQMLLEIRRVLRHTGVLLISSPDRLVYSESPGYSNPFHVKELGKDEFSQLLRLYFRHVRIYGQKFCFGSLIAPLEPLATSSGFASAGGDTGHVAETDGLVDSTYLIAIAGQEDLPEFAAGFWDATLQAGE